MDVLSKTVSLLWGTVANDWTVNIAATNVLQLCQVWLFPPWSEAWSSHATITETTIVHIS